MLPPPQAAIMRTTSNPAASGKNTARQRLGPNRRQLQAIHATPVKNTQSSNQGRGASLSGRVGGSVRGPIRVWAVVVTLTVIFVAVLLGVTVLGETVQVAPAGAPVQVKVTV